MPSEQHLPYKATGDVVVLDGDGSRWVREGEAPNPVSEGEIRDFARSLRETALDPAVAATSAGSLERMWQFLASESDEASKELSGTDLCAALANALDPTCHDVGNEVHFICSSCGCRVDRWQGDPEFDPITPTMMVPEEGPIDPRYCPNCRARVIEGWDGEP